MVIQVRKLTADIAVETARIALALDSFYKLVITLIKMVDFNTYIKDDITYDTAFFS